MDYTVKSSLRQQTLNIINHLPDNEIQKVYDYVFNLIRKAEYPFKPISEKEVLDAIDLSTQQIKRGKCQDMRTALNEICAGLNL